MIQNYFTYDVTHKKSATTNPQIFFQVQAGRLADLLEPLNRGVMALVRPLKTAVFRPKSRYEYIVHRLSKC